MKILHIIASMDPAMGGTSQAVRNMNAALAGRSGISAEVVCLDAPDAGYLGTDPFPVYALGPRKTAWAYSSKLKPWLLDNLQKYDSIIVHGLWLYHLYAVKKVMKEIKNRRSVPLQDLPSFYIMPHGMLDPYFQEAGSRKLKAIRNWFYWHLIESDNIKTADGLLFTCEVELELARANFSNYKPASELNIGLGTADVPAYQAGMKTSFLEKCPGLENAPFYLFLSRIHPKKGVDLLITAYIEMIEKNIDKAGLLPRLVIAGPGTDTVYAEKIIQQLARHPRVEPFVFFPGMLTGNAKWGALYESEVFILPSHQENFGIAVVEALACHKPVLITNQVNIWKEIIDSGGGMAADDSPIGINDLLRNWAAIPADEKIKMGRLARNCFENKFSIDAAADSFIKKMAIAN